MTTTIKSSDEVNQELDKRSVSNSNQKFIILPPIPKVANQGEARQLAKDWQTWQADQSMSYGEVAEYQSYFEALANKFDLVDEFKENGII